RIVRDSNTLMRFPLEASMVGPSGLERVGRMARAYSQDLRDRVIETGLSGPSLRQAARQFGVAASTAFGWVKRLCVEGDRGARRQGRPRGSIAIGIFCCRGWRTSPT